VVSIPGVLLFALGLILLIIGVWTQLHERKNVFWMLGIGMLLVIVGFIVGAAAFGIFTPSRLVSGSVATPTSDVIIAQVIPIEQSSANLPHPPAYAFSTPEDALPIVTLPNYPIPSPVLTITPKPGEAGPDTSPVVRIAIPSLFLDTIVKYVPYDGFSWMISGLREEIAWMGNTSWPGLGSNTALAGHVTVAGVGDGPFRHLDELREGDVVILYTEQNMYTYTIRESRVTDDSDMAVTWATTNPQVTLITCVDWNEELRTYSNRLIVMGDLMRTEPITAGSIP
jgi:sortase A